MEDYSDMQKLNEFTLTCDLSNSIALFRAEDPPYEVRVYGLGLQISWTKLLNEKQGKQWK